jgi:hypothetical protein
MQRAERRITDNARADRGGHDRLPRIEPVRIVDTGLKFEILVIGSSASRRLSRFVARRKRESKIPDARRDEDRPRLLGGHANLQR